MPHNGFCETLVAHLRRSRASLRGMTWLMQGDTITQEEATSLHIRLITQESNLSVSDNTDPDLHPVPTLTFGAQADPRSGAQSAPQSDAQSGE